MAGQGNDFFLQFGSDAEPFSRQLAADLDPGIEKINALREALAAYEEQAAKSKSGSSPLGMSFQGLDQAAARIERATTDFGKQFAGQIQMLTSKVEGLAEVLRSAARPTAGTRIGNRPITGPIGRGGGQPVLNNLGRAELDPAIQARLDAIDRAKRGNNVNAVTPADQAAAEKGRTANREVVDAANKAAAANSLSAKQVTATTKALEGLNDRLRDLIETAKGMPKPGKPATGSDPKAANAEAALQIGNTTANPIPVIVVGGDLQPVASHPHSTSHAAHGHAQSGFNGVLSPDEQRRLDALDRYEASKKSASAGSHPVAEPEVVNAPNSFKNPRQVLPGDTVTKGEWWMLPGQEKPSRAFGIRKGETVGEYSARVDTARLSAEAALAPGQHLDDRSAQILREWQEGHGKLPMPRMRVMDKMGGIVGSETTSAYAGYPDNIARILAARDDFANQRLDLAHGWALGQLRQDPMLTQDGLPGDAKAALARIDSILAGTSRKTVVDQLFEGEDHPGLAELRKGALNRNRLRDQGREAAEEARLAGQAQAAIYGKQGTRDPITGEWYYGTGIQGVNESRDTEFRSNIQQGQIAEKARERAEQGLDRTEDVHNAGSRYRVAQAMADRLASVKPAEGAANAFVDEAGQRVTLENLRTQLNALMSPYLQGELGPQIRRAQSGIRRNNPSSVQKYRDQLAELEAQRNSFRISTSGSFDEQLASLRQVSQRYADFRSNALTEGIVDTARPGAGATYIPSSTASTDNTPAGLVRRGLITPAEADQLAMLAEAKRLNAARPADEVVPNSASPSRRGRRTRSKPEQAAVAPVEEEQEHDWAAYDSSDARMRQEEWDAQAARANAPKRSGGGRKPPRKPPAPPVATPEPEPEPEPEEQVSGRSRRRVSTVSTTNLQGGHRAEGDLQNLGARKRQFEQLDPETRQALTSARGLLARQNLSPEARQAALNRAALALRSDSQWNNGDLWGGGNSGQRSSERVRALTGFLGLDAKDAATRRVVQRSIQQGASELRASTASRNVPNAEDVSATTEQTDAVTRLAAATERAARMEDILASASGREREAMLQEAVAAERLAQVRAHIAANPVEPDSTEASRQRAALANAEVGYSRAQRNSIAAQTQASTQANASRYSQLTGRRPGTTFTGDLVRHGATALENTIGYTLVFTGFEKLRELAQTGIETQAVFVRLQASLDANGIAAGNLQTKLTQISATTATPLEQVTEAAAELSGTLKSSADIEFGTNIASQLANISQGALTAKEAAVGLRDVISAYGDEWKNSGITVQQGIQQAGDQIAHLSQLTGVSVKDITEGTTQLAAEASEYNLTQRQASTMAAYISKYTGESGEESAAQAARVLATLSNGKTQTLLETSRLYGKNGQLLTNPDGSPQTVATQAQFEQGKLGDVLTNIAQYWDKLTPREQQEIRAQMGTGQQARAFSAFTSGGAIVASEMRNGTGPDQGSLNKQNQSYLQTVAGMIKQLDEDFQNLGNTLQRLGAFDALGILAKSIDELLKNINRFVGDFSSLMNSNPLTSGLMHWSVIILEAAAAWKLLGGAVTGALARTGMLRGATAVNQAEIDAAQARNEAGMATPIPRARYGAMPFRQVAGNVGGSLWSRLSGLSTVDPDAAMRWYSRPTASELYNRGTDAASSAFSNAWQGIRNIPASSRQFLSNVPSYGQSALNGLNQAYLRARYGNVVATGENSEAIRAGQVRAALREQGTALRAARANGFQDPTGRTWQASQLGPITSETRSASTALQKFGLSAQSAAILTQTSAEEQSLAMNSLTLRMKTFGETLAGSIASFAAMAGLMIAVGAVLNQLSKSSADAKARNTADNNLLNGSVSAGDFQATQSKGGSRGFFDWYLGNSTSWYGQAGNAAKHTGEGYVNDVAGIATLGHFHPFGAGQAGPSDQSNQMYLDLLNSVYSGGSHMSAQGRARFQNRLQAEGLNDNTAGTVDGTLKGLNSVSAVQRWQKAEDAYIQKHAKDIEQAGGNDKNSQAQIAYSINQMRANFAQSAAARISALEGLSKIDQLNAQQLSAMESLGGTASTLNFETMSTQGAALTTLLQQSGLPTGGSAYKNLETALGIGAGPANKIGINNAGQLGHYTSDGSWHPITEHEAAQLGPTVQSLGNGPAGNNEQRLKALQAVYQQGITVARAKIDAGGLSPQDQSSYLQTLSTSLSQYQQITQELHQAPITREQGRASVLASLGGTTDIAASLGLGSSGDQGATASLIAANKSLTDWTSKLEQSDPQYWQNLQQIQQNKLTIAQLQNQPTLNQLMVATAGASDASTQASLKYQQAVLQLRTDRQGGASLAQLGQDQAGIAAAGLTQRQTTENVAQAQAQANMSGVQNGVTKAQMQYAEALRQEQVYAQGGSLQDRANYLNAIAQANQAQIAIRDAVEQQTQSAFDATAALQKLQGNDAGAAATDLAKANQAYRDAVSRFGSSSQQAQQALATVYQARQAFYQAQVDQINSVLDLDIAQLNARGQQGDAEKAAQDAVQKVRNQINEYLKQGGQKGTSQYNQLIGQLATAQRTAFDTQVQAQLDTLDFQQQTYQITSAQEVASLQQILKNKQLTLQEQRSITLKIKNMQDSIRQQLTEGGLNIPSDIKLPTAYEVRRSIGAGFGGAGTSVSTVNNNQQITVNNNVPNEASAKAIASQVIALINAQNSRAQRATTTTPRLVRTK